MSSPADPASIRRLIRLDAAAASTKGITLKEAGELCGVSLETARSDLDTLHEIAPLEHWHATKYGERRWRYADRQRQVFSGWVK